jgi:hypothetical protein
MKLHPVAAVLLLLAMFVCLVASFTMPAKMTLHHPPKYERIK